VPFITCRIIEFCTHVVTALVAVNEHRLELLGFRIMVVRVVTLGNAKGCGGFYCLCLKIKIEVSKEYGPTSLSS
jgi:hypothetical protein